MADPVTMPALCSKPTNRSEKHEPEATRFRFFYAQISTHRARSPHRTNAYNKHAIFVRPPIRWYKPRTRVIAMMYCRHALLIALTLGTTSALAQQHLAPPSEAAPSPLEGLLMATLEQVVPSQYTDDSKWGRTKPQTVGLKFERDGLKLEVRRRKKEVNDGLWKLYRVDLPPSDQWEVSLSELLDLGDGRAAFDATFATPLHVHARASNWEHGVQLFSLSADADAKVRLTMRCELRLKLIGAQFPPAIRLEPQVTHADLRIETFRLRRISQLHGPLVKELGGEAHDFLQREVNKRSEKLITKLNGQIEKHADKLTLSWADLNSTKLSLLTMPARSTSE